MTSEDLDEYIELLDRAGGSFGANFSRFQEMQGSAESLKLGGEADAALAGAIKSMMRFEGVLKDLEAQRLPMLGFGHLKQQKRKVIEHSSQNLNHMKQLVASVDQHFVKVAMTKIMIDELRTAEERDRH